MWPIVTRKRGSILAKLDGIPGGKLRVARLNGGYNRDSVNFRGMLRGCSQALQSFEPAGTTTEGSVVGGTDTVF